MKLFIVEVQEIYSRSAPSEYVCTIEHLFALTNILDKARQSKSKTSVFKPWEAL